MKRKNEIRVSLINDEIWIYQDDNVIYLDEMDAIGLSKSLDKFLEKCDEKNKSVEVMD
jgi:hypothetical protein